MSDASAIPNEPPRFTENAEVIRRGGPPQQGTFLDARLVFVFTLTATLAAFGIGVYFSAAVKDAKIENLERRFSDTQREFVLVALGMKKGTVTCTLPDGSNLILKGENMAQLDESMRNFFFKSFYRNGCLASFEP